MSSKKPFKWLNKNYIRWKRQIKYNKYKMWQRNNYQKKI